MGEATQYPETSRLRGLLNFLGAKGGGLRARLPLSRLMQTAGFASKGDVLFSSGEKSLVPSTIARGRR